MFVRYDHRTLDVDIARRFYRDALGLSFTEDALAVWPLHEQARARGAPPHWLGQIGVADFEATLKRFLDAGAERLGPIAKQDGVDFTVLRDPFGAIVNLRASTKTPERRPIAWHHLHTKDLDRAWPFYAETFGWEDAGVVDDFQQFKWNGEIVGSMANTARMPGVHTHWLYYFPVDDIEATEAKIVAAGGEVFVKSDTKTGSHRLAACHDPQRAAFGIISR